MKMPKILGTLTTVLAAGALGGFAIAGSGDGATLSLEAAGSRTVELTDFVIDPGASVLTRSVSVNGDVAAEDAPLFLLDDRTLKPLQVHDNGTAVLEGTTVKLKAARDLGRADGDPAVRPGAIEM
jgi:hypothetical protein